MTDAKHEAPAEGAGEDDKLLHDSYIAMRDAMKLIDADEGPGRVHSNALQALAGCRHRIEVRTSAQYALRARSSAPEAREPAFLGHLVAPKSGVGAVFVPKGSPVPLMDGRGTVTPVFDGPQNVTHPAAPSADKLRVAVEALEKTRKLVSGASSTGFTDQDSVRALFVNNGAITRALAVLESGAK